MDSGLEELLETFKEEAAEIFEAVDMNLLSLEKDLENMDIVNGIFRSIHTLKGSAGMMGMEKTSQLAHAFEDMLDKIRSRVVTCNSDLVSLFFSIMDCLKDMVRDETTGNEPGNEYLDYISQLKNRLSSGTEKTVAATMEITIDKSTRKEAQEKQEEGFNVFILDIPFEEMCLMKSSSAFLAVSGLEEFGEVVKVFPDLEDPSIEELESFKALFATKETNLDEVLEATEIPGMTLKAQAELFTAEKAEAPQPAEAPKEKAEASSGGGNDSEQKEEQFSVKIPMDRIQEMMNMVDELFIGKSKFSNLVEEIKEAKPNHTQIKPLISLSRNIDKLTSKIQKMVIDIRKIPLGWELNKLNRRIRDFLHDYEREAILKIVSNEVEIDLELWKKLHQAVEIILENSISKSIEPPGEREGKGKGRKGLITITSEYLDSDIRMTITDDGHGFDSSSMSDLDKIHEIMSSINGKFYFSHEGETDEGMKCRLRVPTNLSKIEVFFFKINDNIYALPTSSIDRIVKLKGSEIKTIKGKKVFVHRDSVVSFLDVEGAYNGENPDRLDREKVLSIIITDNEKNIAIPVDEVVGEDEILIKKFENSIIDSRYIIGATVLGDGRVIIILNPSALISEGRVMML